MVYEQPKWFWSKGDTTSALTKETRSSSGYLSSHDPRVTFGIGQYQKIESLTIYWPNGTVQRLENISVNQQITVVEETQQ